MPMDYDDNDISHHNLQLVGESRARSSSALRPYDFPKFDFDDSLQGHLRFDSLVETEVFLGIQSQEVNQWIEDFSRGSNGMEFNSTPADPCSISRRDNVWSEATSSESVEMLLKSVGQEEMMPRASIIQDSDANIDQGTLSELVESSNGKLKEINDAHDTTADTTLPQDEALKNYLGSSGHIEEQLELENPSAALTEDESRCGDSSKLNQNASCGNGGTMTDEGKYSYNAESTSEILEECNTSVERTMGEGGSLDFPSITTDHVVSAIEMLSTSKACEQVDSSVPHESCIGNGQDNHVSSKIVLENAAILQGETGVTSVHMCSVGSPLDFVPDSERENLEANLDSGIVKGEFDLKSSKRDDCNISFTTSIEKKRPGNALAVSNDMNKPFDNCQSGSCIDVVEDSAEFGSIISGHCASPTQVIDPTVKLPHNRDSNNMKDLSGSHSKHENVSDMPLLSMEGNEAATATLEHIDKALLSSTADHKHLENSEGCLKDTIATGEDSIAHLLDDDTNIPIQVIQDNLDAVRADFSESEKDMCNITGADKEIPSALEKIDSKNIGTLKNDHKTQSPEVIKELDVGVALHKLVSQTSEQPESGKKGSTFTSVKASTALTGHPDVGVRETATIRLHPDNFQKEVEMVDGKVRAELDNASMVGVSLVDTVQIPISEISAMSQQPVEKVDNIFSNVPSSKEALGSLSLDAKQSSLKKNVDVASGGKTMCEEEKKSEQTSGKKGSTFASIEASTASAGHPDVGLREVAAIGLHPDNFKKEVEKVDGNLQAEVDNASKVGVSLVDASKASQQHVEKNDNIFSNAPSSKEVLGSLSLDATQSSLMKNVDLASGGNTMSEEEKKSGHTADFDMTLCGSPTIISSNEPTQLERDNQEEGRNNKIGNEVKGIQSTSEVSKRIDFSGDDSGFSFKVDTSADTIDKEPGKNKSPFPDVEKNKVLEGTAPSGKGKTKRSLSQKTPHQNAKLFDGEKELGTSKGTSERKGRRGSAKGSTKENAKKGNQSKSPNQEKASLKAEKVSNSLLSPPSRPQHYGNVETTNENPLGGVTVPISNLPDLNSSAMSNTAASLPTCRQPFSDLQQVQLRAQIFVYGSLIQGHVPDETLMGSAFGQYEGGRSFWERTWRAASERVENQKSSSTAAETPRSQSGARASGSVKQGAHSSKVSATPTSGVNSKANPAAVLSPIFPLMSPPWNISTSAQDSLTPGRLYQTPIRNFVSHTSFPSQTGFSGPCLTSPHTSSFSSNAQFRPVSMTETVKLTPIKETSAVLNSTGKHTTFSPVGQAVRPALREVSPIHDPICIASAAQHSVGAKPRKRKKVPASDPGQVTFSFNVQTGSKVISNMASNPVIPVSALTPLVSDTILSKPAADASAVSFVELPKKPGIDQVKHVACSEETLSKVAEAKRQAENAAALSDAAVTHCEDFWAQLAKQKDSGLTSNTEAKLASSAVAIAAAASVAKAAAAAARIACSAALQAKLMADNALNSSKICGVIPSSGEFSSNMHDAGNTTPASMLKTNSDTNESSSILVAAKEAAKRRVEAALVASRQAENMDAIVKASELAAVAVSQAGKIVAMGEPSPLNDLIEAGPEGYWKLPHQSGSVSSDKAGGIPACIPSVDSVEKGGPGIGKDYIHLSEGRDSLLNALNKQTDKKDLRTGIDHEASDMSKSSSGAPVIDTPSETTNVNNDCDEMAAQDVDCIKEGSHIEVFNPRSAQKSAWYTADVLSVEEGKAFVCYNNLLSESKKDSVYVQEWVPLESDGDKVPNIRTAHPSFAFPYQRTGKRRRAALGDYVWCVGDRVDVWIDDCWWEGVVTGMNEKDETTLKVHLSAQGETQTVGAWNLRPSRSWINGEWISSKSQSTSEQSDTPLKKRPKLDSLVSKSEAEPNNLNFTLEKPERSKFLTLSTSETMFDIGKTTTIESNKHAARRPVRTNQQKEGSRVVFGVPKPTGKKRKFMDVSKHFSANKSDKSNEQGAPPRGWKAPTRNDYKDKRIVESRPTGLNTHKAQRNLPPRDNTRRSKFSQNADISIDQGNHLEDSVSHDDNTSDKPVNHGPGAFEESAEAPLSSLVPHSLSTSSKRIPSLSSKTDRVNRGRQGPSIEKLSKTEDKVYFANTSKSHDVSEPRRSNRRIQPTHRLLEGLQSSMAIPKMPAVSHDKSRGNLLARGK